MKWKCLVSSSAKQHTRCSNSSALHKRPPHQSIGHGLAEGFILYEFIPHSEALFSISEGLKEVQAPAPHTAKADALTAFSRIWNEVHNRVLAAGTSLLQKVRRARKDVSKPSVAVEALELAALAKYAQKVKQSGERLNGNPICMHSSRCCRTWRRSYR